jgi:hypothetical protein
MIPYMSAELVISLFQLQEGLPNIGVAPIPPELPSTRDREHQHPSLGFFEMLLIRLARQRGK